MNRIEKAIDIFLDAINNGTLVKGTCVACVVGNLVAYGLGAPIFKRYHYFDCELDNISWKWAFYTVSNEQRIFPEKFKDPAVLKCVKATDFSLEELMKIENAFETNTEIPCDHYFDFTSSEIRADQIKGLAAVIKVMETFDNIEPDKYINKFKTTVISIPV